MLNTSNIYYKVVIPDEFRVDGAIVNSGTVSRFWAKVKIIPGTGCFEWQGWLDKDGYGEFKHGLTGDGTRCNTRAHRYSWCISNLQEIPAGKVICHKCDNPPCVNPDHLFMDTLAKNSQDKHNKGRNTYQRGESNPTTELTYQDVTKIKSLLAEGVRPEDVASTFGRSRGCIYEIRVGVNWKEVPWPDNYTPPTRRKVGRRKLSPYQVTEIEELVKFGGLSNREIGSRYSVSGGTVSRIKKDMCDKKHSD